MVTQRILIKDKWRKPKKVLLVFGMFLIITIILSTMFTLGFFSGEKTEIILENPLKKIVLSNMNEFGQVDEQAVIEQGILEFSEEYINYLLIAIGIDSLHKSPVLENPLIEFVLDKETWSSEIIKGIPNTKKEAINNEDLRISISKAEAINALLSSDIEQFMKDSVTNGNTQIEMVAGKTELFSKGYLEMYKKLTGEDVVAEQE